MRSRSWLPLLLSSTTLTLASCGDDAPVVPPGDTTTGGTTDGTTAAPPMTSSSDGDPDSTGTAPGCGDGLRAEGEDCDDGNTDDDDGCSATCTLEDGWVCNGQPSACLELCGDGLVVGNEACDDDNLLNGDGCSVECTLENGYTCEGVPSECTTVCGDGIVVSGEVCDDANLAEGDGCSAVCQVEQGYSCSGQPSTCGPICGDGLILDDEACDDDNLAAGDGCSSTCEVELGWACGGEPSVCMTGCGDGIIAGMEQCDDLGNEDGDGCSAACELESGWICMGEPSTCTTACGDGLIAGPESCDDGGLASGDGCDAACELEPGWLCTGEPTVCVTACGDGFMVGGEECDDGGIAQGDGCNHLCAVDFGWDCVGSPSACFETALLDTVALGGLGGCVLSTLGEVGCFGTNVQSQVGNGTTNVATYLPAFALSDVTAIAAGHQFNCAIRVNGSVWCWGDNANRQMGPLSTPPTDESLPIEITGLPPVVAIDAGDDHVCALDGLGQVWCWGDNDNRQLGLGGAITTDSEIPTIVPMPGGLAAIDLGLGQDHSCVVLENNTVACWGDDDNGQLGDGASGTDRGEALVVPGLAVVNDVEGGEDTTCALTDLGQVWCWGDNIDGQVGNGTLVDNANPQLVGLPSAAAAISLGDQYSCALLVTGQAFCWGEGDDFQLGNLDWARSNVPAEVLNLPPVPLVDIEAGGRGACVLSATNERYCWGHSEGGNLGIAPRNALEPVPVMFSGPVAELVVAPPEFRGVMCGVLLDGTVECAGDGTLVSTSITLGATGLFEPMRHHLAVPTTLPLLAGVQHIRLGNDFACATTSTNVLCWGDNSQRQLGQGGTSTVDIITPVPVLNLGAVDELEVGGEHACIRIGGTVQCWGDNSDRQTGEPAVITDQSLPVTVMNLADATALALGENHSCVLRSTGVVSCWGDDLNGQLGDNDNNSDDSGVPLDVTGLPAGVVQVGAGQDHNCALAGGEVYCWGEGGFGNLGQGNELDSDTALLVPGLSGIVQIAVGWNYNCALDGAGDMWCWGYSLHGHLGDGGDDVTGINEVHSPVPFAVASGITNVRAGNAMTCIETASGWSCLGFRSAGQLGNGTSVWPVMPTAATFGF